MRNHVTGLSIFLISLLMMQFGQVNAQTQRPNYQSALTALEGLQALLIEHRLLDEEQITWEDLTHVIKKALKKMVKPQKIALSELTRLLEYYGGSIEHRLT
ncbi:hypothetical protein [Chroococcus sp. FPU101]|uniref:hypothetical protein n=1 Tax=Chroococcus sp. FPU101 TaxID=1974212 RepID=UPI001A8D487C|nr:hypothetical protein [Chroococcus sp. FPU101]GFE71320.1 hypothetical protein CFPU101_39300 [Chroococcus sp. FPU101]